MLVMVLCLGLAVVPGRAAVYFELWDAIPPVGTGENEIDANNDGNPDNALLEIDWVTIPGPDGKNDQTDTLVGPTGTLANFGVGAFEVNDDIEDYTYRQIGIINIATAGNYNFWVSSDDGGVIFVDGEIVAGCPGWYAIYDGIDYR